MLFALSPAKQQRAPREAKTSDAQLRHDAHGRLLFKERHESFQGYLARNTLSHNIKRKLSAICALRVRVPAQGGSGGGVLICFLL